MNPFFAAVAGLLAGATGAMGLGGGGVLLIFLTVFSDTEQIRAQGMNLLFFLACALTAGIIHIKNKTADLKILPQFLIPGVLGALLGTWLAGSLETKLLRILFAVFLLIFGAKELFAKTPKKECAEGGEKTAAADRPENR